MAYYNVKYLTDYFRKKGIVPKFYFIVDRLDLLIQAGREFKSRRLIIHNINSREEFSRDIKSNMVIHNDSGKAEITVVNIQKFKDDPDVISNNDYQLSIQRIFFLEVELMLDYVVQDFERARNNEASIGGMVICDSSDQAKKMHEIFQAKYSPEMEESFSISAGQYFEVKIEYINITHDEFETKIKGFEENLTTLFAESKTLETEIQNNLKGLKYEKV